MGEKECVSHSDPVAQGKVSKSIGLSITDYSMPKPLLVSTQYLMLSAGVFKNIHAVSSLPINLLGLFMSIHALSPLLINLLAATVQFFGGTVSKCGGVVA